MTDWEVPGVVIKGSVYAADGAPLAGLPLTLAEPYDSGEFDELVSTGKRARFDPSAISRRAVVTTGADGSFTFAFPPNLRKGSNWLIPPLQCWSCDLSAYLLLHIDGDVPLTLAATLTGGALQTRAVSPQADRSWHYSVGRIVSAPVAGKRTREQLLFTLRRLSHE